MNCISSLIDIEHIINGFPHAHIVHRCTRFHFTLLRHDKCNMRMCVCECVCASDLSVRIDYWARPPRRTNNSSIFGAIRLLRQTHTHTFIKTLWSVIRLFQPIAYEHAQTLTHANNHRIGSFMRPLLRNVTHMHAVTHPFPAESMLKALRRWDERSAAQRSFCKVAAGQEQVYIVYDANST